MAAPTLAGEGHSTGSGQTACALPASGVVAGDLLEFRYLSNTDTGATPTISYTSGGATAGFTLILDTMDSGSVGRRCIVWSKIATSTDAAGSTSYTISAVAGTARVQVKAFHHANGWTSQAASLYYSNAHNVTTGGNPWTIGDWTNKAGPLVGTCGVAFNTATNSLTLAWDADAARAPVYDESVFSGAIQSDYKLYDTTDTSDKISSPANVTVQHAANVVIYQVSAPTVTGTAAMVGGGTFAAGGLPQVLGTATLSGGGTFQATGVKTVLGVAALAGGGTFLAAQQGVTVVTGVATMVGGGTFTARGARRGTAALTGGGTFHASGVRTTFATSAVLSGGGSFSTAGVIGTVAGGTDGEWAEGAATIPGGLTWNGVAAMAGGGTFHATGITVVPGGGLAQFLGGGTFHATGITQVSGVAVLDGGGTFNAIGASLGQLAQRVQFRPRQRVAVRG